MRGIILLNNKEWLRINDLIITINISDDIDLMRDHFLKCIKYLIPFEKAVFFLGEQNGDDYVLVRPISMNAEKEFIEEYEKFYHDIDYASTIIDLHSSQVYKDTDLMEEKIRKETKFYKDFLIPHEVPYAGGMIIAKNSVLTGEVTFYRTFKQGDFSEKDLYIMEIVISHLEYRIHQLTHINNGYTKIFNKDYLKLLDANISKREIEIIKLAVNGYSNIEISKELNISINTVKKHLSSIFIKLDINNRTQLLLFVMDK